MQEIIKIKEEDDQVYEETIRIYKNSKFEDDQKIKDLTDLYRDCKLLLEGYKSELKKTKSEKESRPSIQQKLPPSGSFALSLLNSQNLHGKPSKQSFLL